MARKPRIHRPAAFYHVMLRGNNGQPIFFSNSDQCRLCILLQQGVERYGHRIHGFCFMPNHIHLIIQVGENTLSKAIHHLAFRYTRYINFKEKRVGHLFQGRFKAILIDDRDYLLELIRYVHLNPVRANIVARPDDYFWSSHSAYLGVVELPWLTQEWILAKFDIHSITAMTKFVQYINRGIGEIQNYVEFKNGSREGRFLGADKFINRVLEEHRQKTDTIAPYSLQELVNIVCKVTDTPLALIKTVEKGRKATNTRAIIAYFVKHSPHLTLKGLAELVSRDSSALSKLAQKTEQDLLLNSPNAVLIDNVKQQLAALRISRSQA